MVVHVEHARICLECEHCYMDEGAKISLECFRGRWRLDAFDMTKPDLLDALDTARTCPDYSIAEWVTTRYQLRQPLTHKLPFK